MDRFIKQLIWKFFNEDNGFLDKKKLDTDMTKNIIPFAKAQRSVKEVVEKFYQDLDDIEEIVIIAKDREGEWIFANSELENELEWIGSLYKFINKAILEEGEEF